MLNIILFQPEIPENTGNIARTCVAFNARLHLIRPYGFFLTSKAIKRSSVTYWDKLDLHEYDSYDEFVQKNNINNESNHDSNTETVYLTSTVLKSININNKEHSEDIFGINNISKENDSYYSINELIELYKKTLKKRNLLKYILKFHQ